MKIRCNRFTENVHSKVKIPTWRIMDSFFDTILESNLSPFAGLTKFALRGMTVHGDRMNENFSVAAEYQYLPNGRYRGVVVKCLIGRFSTDGFEVHCFDERNTKDEAIRDAKNLAKKIQVKPNFII